MGNMRGTCSLVISILAAVAFVGLAHAVPHEKGVDSSTSNATSTNSSTGNPATVRNTTNVQNNNATDTKALGSNRGEDGKLLKINETQATIAPSNQSVFESADGLPDQKQGQNCHYKKETTDMTKCHVMPHDDDDKQDQNDDVPAITPSTSTAAENTKDAKDESAVNVQNKTSHKLVYATVAPQTDAASSDVVDASGDDTEIIIQTVAPLFVENVRNIETKHTKVDAKPMPEGIIALVIAVSFALVIIFIYVSVVAWRRYVEYKYGHRELLVNDLEFDTNDLRHFEL